MARESPAEFAPVLARALVRHIEPHEVRAAFDAILSGAWTPVQVAAFAVALRMTGLQALEAIDAHDARALLRVGGSLDAVCEACHLRFWYPNQLIPPFPEHAPVYGEFRTPAPRKG